MKYYEALDSLKDIERAYLASREGLRYYLSECEKGSIDNTSLFTLSDIRTAYNELESTYIVRIFARFEYFLRKYWVSNVRDTNPMMEVLIDRIASRRSIDTDTLLSAHRVREYRNKIIHGNGSAEKIDMPDARGSLCKYVNWLPEDF